MKVRFFIAVLISMTLMFIVEGAYAQDAQYMEERDEHSGSEPLVISSPTNAVNLDGLLQISFENNPRIQAARAEWEASIQKYPQARSWPDPQLNSNWVNGWNNPGLEIMQMIPYPEKTRLKGKKAVTMAEIAQLSFEKTVRDELVNLIKSYYEIGYLNRAIEITSKNHDLFRQIVELGRIKNSEGTLGANELYAAETRLAQSEYELILLEDLKQTEISNLRKSLGKDTDFIPGEINLPAAIITELDLDSLRKTAKEHRQELGMAGLSVETAEIELSLARALTKPDFSVGFMYNWMGKEMTSGSAPPDDMSSSPEDNYSVTMGISLPIWSGKNRGRINEAKANLEASKALLKSQSDSTNEAVDRIYYRVKNLSRLLILYRESIVPQTQNAQQIAQTLYEAGEVPFSQLLETRIASQNIEIAGYRAEADYLQAVAELAKILGTPVTGSITGEPKTAESEVK
ncbi:MAG: TolC family protein [bacterium]